MSEPNPIHPTREAWLLAFASAARPVFAAAGAPIPDDIRVSMGFPLGSRKAVGQCWGSTAAVDGVIEMFISPVHETGLKAADTLTHELCHAADRCEHGHKAPFKRIAEAVGLRGKMTGAFGEGHAPWHAWADPILADLGPFPGAQMTPGGGKKQTTRMLKVTCSECDIVLRMSGKHAPFANRCVCDECDGYLTVHWPDEGEEG